jgi:sulfite reductase beta subunit-like hemoprotein
MPHSQCADLTQVFVHSYFSVDTKLPTHVSTAMSLGPAKCMHDVTLDLALQVTHKIREGAVKQDSTAGINVAVRRRQRCCPKDRNISCM